MYTSAFGCLDRDPKQIHKTNGCRMTASSMSVKFYDECGDSCVRGLYLIGGGSVAESLDRFREGDLASVSGYCLPYQTKDGAGGTRFEFAMLVDSIELRELDLDCKSAECRASERYAQDMLDDLESTIEPAPFDDPEV